MNTEESANTMVNYHTTVAPMLRGIASQGAQNPQLTQPVMHPGIPVGRELCAAVGAGMHRLIVENLFCPVTLDVLHQIRSKFGTISKIFTFTKNNQFWMRLQQADRGGQHAKLSLGGQNLYNACCALHIDFSKLNRLNIKYNNKSRDYTRLHLPPGDSQTHDCSIWYAQCNVSLSECRSQVPSHLCLPSVLSVPYAHRVLPLSPLRRTFCCWAAMAGHIAILDLVGARNSILLVSNLNLERVTPQGPSILSGVYGDAQRVTILLDKENAPTCTVGGGQPGSADHEPMNGQAQLQGISAHHTVKASECAAASLQELPELLPLLVTLHLSNIPPSVSEDDSKSILSSGRQCCQRFQVLPEGPQGGADPDGLWGGGGQALIELHFHDLELMKFLKSGCSSCEGASTKLLRCSRPPRDPGLDQNFKALQSFAFA
ncbi:hypothetical protein U0070_025161, partial [Myodes glareolus]